MSIFINPKIPRAEYLKFIVDGGNQRSYTGTNASCDDVLGKFDQTAISSPTYTSSDEAFNFTGLPSAEGGGSYFNNLNNCQILGNTTLNGIIAPTYNVGPHKTVICTDTNYRYGCKLMSFKNNHRYGIWIGFGANHPTYPGGFEAFTGGNISDGTRKMITGVWDEDAGQARVYLNGVRTSTHNVGNHNQVLSNGRIHVGVEYHAFGSGPYQGKIFQTSIHNYALNDEEVYLFYESVKERYQLP